MNTACKADHTGNFTSNLWAVRRLVDLTVLGLNSAQVVIHKKRTAAVHLLTSRSDRNDCWRLIKALTTVTGRYYE
jgi:hypothetical protein